MIDALTIRPVGSAMERQACARLMSESEPWLTLQRDFETSLALVSDPTRETYWIEHAGTWAGFLLLYLQGPFRGYIQTICLTPDVRGRGLGTAVLDWAEARRRLILSTRQDAFTTPCWNARWGYGKININRLMEIEP